MQQVVRWFQHPEDLPAPTAYRLLWVLLVTTTVVFALAASAKFVWFGQGHDLALHHQAIWNTTQGRVFEVTGFVYPPRLFGYDPYLIELLVVPLYALLPSVHTLLALQALVLGLGALAVWLLARQAGLLPVLALLAALLYLAHPTVQYTNLDAFRERSFGLCCFLWAMWAMRGGRWWWFVLFLVLLIICRLEAALLASMFGVYALLRGAERRYVVVPLVLGLGYFFAGNFWFVPLVNQGSPVEYVYDYFDPLGTSMGEVLVTVVTRPLYTLEAVFTWEKVGYVLLLLLPLAFLPLLSPRVLLLALPLLAINLLASKPQLYDVRYWYSALLVGPLIVATIDTLAWLPRRVPLLQRRLWLLIAPLLVCLLFAQWMPRNPLVSLVLYREPPQRVSAAREMLGLIEPAARVAATSRLAPHLLRRSIYYYPLAHPDETMPTLEYIAADTTAAWMDDAASRARFEAMRTSAEWELLYDREGFQLYRRSPPPGG